MESKDRQYDPEKGRVKGRVLPFVPRVTKDIGLEPEIKALKRMVQAGELNPNRTVDYLEGGGMEKVYNLEAASKKLGISVRGLREFIKRGELRARKVGRAYLVTEQELTRFLEPPEEEPGTAEPDFMSVSEFSKKTGIPEPKVKEWLRGGILRGAKGYRNQWLVDPKMVKWWAEIRTAINPK